MLTNIFGDIEYMYQPDPATLVVFTGYDEVKSISIRGTPASRIGTRRGARFGFTAVSVLRLYSRYESKTVRERIEYPGLGISFYFADDNRVNTMVIFEPD